MTSKMSSSTYLHAVGYSEEDVMKRRLPQQLDSITNGFIYEANKHFEDNNNAFIDYIFKVTGNNEFKHCNQKSLRRKISDMIATAKKRRRNKDKKFHAFLSTEFKAPVRTQESRAIPSRNDLLLENETLKKKLADLQSDFDALQNKYEEVTKKLKT